MPNYTDQSKIEEYIGTTLDDDFAGALDAWLPAIDDYIDRLTGRQFHLDESDSTKYYDGKNEDTLFIDDLNSLTSLVVYDSSLSTIDRTCTSDDYLLLPLNKRTDEPYSAIRVHPDGYYLRWPAGIKRVYVTGKFGWPKIPKQVTLAATMLAANLYEERHAANRQASSERLGEYSITYDKLDDSARRLKVDMLLGQFMRFSYL